MEPVTDHAKIVETANNAIKIIEEQNPDIVVTLNCHCFTVGNANGSLCYNFETAQELMAYALGLMGK